MAEMGKAMAENIKIFMFVKKKKSRHMAQQILINTKLPGEILEKNQIKILYFTNKCSDFFFKYISRAIRTMKKPRDSNGSAGAFSAIQSAQNDSGDSGSYLVSVQNLTFNSHWELVNNFISLDLSDIYVILQI